MKKFLCLVFVAGLLTGCLPTQPEESKAADAAKKKEAEAAAEAKLSAVAPVTPGSFNEHTYEKRGLQALADELDREEQRPVKVLVEARK